MTTHNTHNRKTSMPPVGFEPTISAGERPQTHALDRAATGTGNQLLEYYINWNASYMCIYIYERFLRQQPNYSATYSSYQRGVDRVVHCVLVILYFVTLYLEKTRWGGRIVKRNLHAVETIVKIRISSFFNSLLNIRISSMWMGCLFRNF